MPIPATILVVDDQAYVRHTLGSLLAQQRHWSIYEAADGRAALDRARRLKPDVVVMEIVMPKMDGIAAAYELRQFAPETKVCPNQQPLHAPRSRRLGSIIWQRKLRREIGSS